MNGEFESKTKQREKERTSKLETENRLLKQKVEDLRTDLEERVG